MKKNSIGVYGFYLSTDNSTHYGCDSLIGIGKYKIEFWNVREDDGMPVSLVDYCYIDFSDYDYPANGYQNNDVWIRYYSDNNITFRFTGDEININNSYANRDLKMWYQINYLNTNPPTVWTKPQNKGNFKTTTTTNGLSYLNFPIKATSYTGFSSHFDYGSLYVNFSVASGHHAYIKQNETMYVENAATFNLLSGSILTFQNNSTLYIKNLGRFCNYGGRILGAGRIIFEGRLRCADYQDFVIGDSTQVVLQDSACWELPSGSTVIFEGNGTNLEMEPGTQMKFGSNSKLVFRDGARIFADSCSFSSLETDSTWDGIYLSNDANDTIKNCVIQNAYNGINISAPTSFTPYTTEITNCTFKNTTNTQLLNQVYINGANGILIKGCNTESNISSGFASCIVMQYSHSGSVVITDNSFAKCDIGITAIQSSPYIARNVITGLTGSGVGIYLDNSNGTIEYNQIARFEKSIECGYSSPYLLKNTFSDASDKSIQLYSSSVPVMKPVTSGTLTRWLGGNNRITGLPSTAAIVIEKESYPMMDSGYNIINVTSSNYIQGDLKGDLYATINNWYDNPPNSSLFNTAGGTVYYDPTFNGSSLPSTDYYELNNIGFGMYDSEYVKDNGDNPTAGSLFMQAYTNEMQGNYTIAISKYKDVVTEYKTSSFAPVSLARIFNCLEKNNSNSTAYSQIQSYYSNIKSDTNNSTESREIAEDFAIKSKVRQNNIMEAVTDYENIYQSNQNNYKGQHALLNKLCLLQMLSGGDNPISSGGLNNKANIISLICGKPLNQNITSINNNIPETFKLYQNYPNPFNPTTSIKYEIPNDANVSFKIYDILGKEIFRINEYKKAGSYEVRFDGSNLASGMYFYKLVVGDNNSGVLYSDTKKMVLLK